MQTNLLQNQNNHLIIIVKFNKSIIIFLTTGIYYLYNLHLGTNKSFSLSKCLYKFCHSRMIQSIILFLMFHSPPSVSISELDFDECVVTYYCRSIGTDCMPSCSNFSCMHHGSWYKTLFLSTNRSCNRIACWSKEQDQLPLMLCNKYVLDAYLHFRKNK